MANQHQLDISERDDGAVTAEFWSPRKRLFFLLGFIIVSWGALTLLFRAWV